MRPHTRLLPVFLLLLVQACNRPPEIIPERHHVTSKNELYPFLDTLEHAYQQACTTAGRAEWNRISGLPSTDPSPAMFASLWNDTAAHAIVEDWRRRSGSLADKPLARRLELWHRIYLGGLLTTNDTIRSIQDSLRRTMAEYTASLPRGRRYTPALLPAILRDEKKQPQRKTAWMGMNELTRLIAPQLTRLADAQNRYARGAGFPNYYSLLLYLESVDEEWLVKSVTSMEEQTRKPFEALIAAAKKRIRVQHFGPWDYDYAFRESPPLPDKLFPFRSVLDSITALEQGMGFHSDTLPIHPTLGNCPVDGIGIPVAIPSCANFMVRGQNGIAVYRSAAREFGRALQAVLTRTDYPIQRGYPWIPGACSAPFLNGVAGMHELFVTDSLWLASSAKVKPRLIDRYQEFLQQGGLLQLRHRMMQFTLALEYYKDPGQDIFELDSALCARYLRWSPDSLETDLLPVPLWSIAAGGRAIDSVLSDMVSAQLFEAMYSKFGRRPYSDTAVAAWFTGHLAAPGETQEWTERMRNATGKSLDPGPFLRTLGVEPLELITHQEPSDTSAREP